MHGLLARDGAQFYFPLAPAQLDLAQAGRAVPRPQVHALQQVGGDEQRLFEFLARLLDARGSVDRVAEIDDLVLVVAAFPGDDRPAVQADPELRNHAEIPLVRLPLGGDAVADREIGIHAPRVLARAAERIGDEGEVWASDDGLVAGAPLFDGLSDDALQELLNELSSGSLGGSA